MITTRSSPRRKRVTRTSSGSSRSGSQEFQTLKNQVVQFLVQREQFEQEAEALDVEITEKQVDAQLEQVQQYFQGDRKKYKTQLKAQGFSERQVRKDIRGQIVSEKIFGEVTWDVKVTDKQVAEYYAKNKAQYSQPESLSAPHPGQDARRQMACTTSCRRRRLSALAKKFSEDTGSKATGAS